MYSLISILNEIKIISSNYIDNKGNWVIPNVKRYLQKVFGATPTLLLNKMLNDFCDPQIDNDGLQHNTSLNDIILKDSKKSNKAYIEEQLYDYFKTYITNY